MHRIVRCVPRAGHLLSKPPASQGNIQIRHLPTISILQHRCNKSTSASSPKVLAKPSKYVPPSHPTGPRKPSTTILPRKPHVPESTKRYPNTMPHKGTFHHWILHSRGLHGLLTMSILIGLAVYVAFNNFLETDPSAHMVFWNWRHPLLSMQSFIAAYRESDRLNTERIMEKRRKLSEDIEKRAHYRYVVEGKTGADEEGFGSWGVRRSAKDEAMGWGVVIDGKRIDELIDEREREKKEKAARDQLGIVDGGVAAGVDVSTPPPVVGEQVISAETKQITPAEAKKKTSFLWW